MPNIKSAKKELRISNKKRIYNSKIKNNLKKLIKESKKLISLKDNNAKNSVKEAIKVLDKASQKKIIKKNTCARKKSRLQKRFNGMKE